MKMLQNCRFQTDTMVGGGRFRWAWKKAAKCYTKTYSAPTHIADPSVVSISKSTLRKSRDNLKLAHKYTQTSLVDSESWQYGKFRAHGVQKLHTGKNHDQGHSRNRRLGKKHRLSLIFSSHPAKFSRMVERNAMYHELAHVQQHLPYAWRCEPLECYIGHMKLISWAPPKEGIRARANMSAYNFIMLCNFIAIVQPSSDSTQDSSKDISR